MASNENQNVCDWQLYCDGVKERVEHILKVQQWTDCSFLVGAEQPATVKAHKLMLAMASPVFEAMFYGPMAEADAPIRIPDMEPLVFQALLKYIYTDQTGYISDILVIHLYYGAQKYMIPKLQAACVSDLSKNLKPENVCRVYEFSLKIGDMKLTANCEKMIKEQCVMVLESSSFLELEMDTVSKIFSFENIKIDNELVLIKAVERYYKALKARSAESEMLTAEDKTDMVANGIINSNKEDEENDSTPPKIKQETEIDKDHSVATSKLEKNPVGGEEKDSERLILKLLHKIRFLTLTAQQFAGEKICLSLLTHDEVSAIMVNLAYPGGASMPMPEGFSTSKINRCSSICSSGSQNCVRKKCYKCSREGGNANTRSGVSCSACGDNCWKLY